MTKEFATRSCSALKMVFLVLFGLFFMSNEVLAATIFTTDFEPPTYSTGLLNGQNGWVDTGQVGTVVDTSQKHGTQSVYFHTTTFPTTYHAGTPTCIGSMGFWFKPMSNVKHGEIVLMTTNGQYDGVFNLYFGYLNQPQLAYVPYGGGFVVLGSYELGTTWYAMDIEWVCDTALVRYRYNYGSWTDWVVNWKNTTSPAQDFYWYWDWSGDIYFDFLGESSEIPVCGEVGGCSTCSIWQCGGEISPCCWWIDECIEGACYIGGGTCGSGSNLFFCETQEECESYDGYWWQGTCSSYIQPYLPPQDTCEGLGTIEKWLCEIKNLLKGVFVPSQEKTEELRQTIDVVKQKFPMNYLSGASSFFNSVKGDINSSSDIEFKILGKTGKIDFAFWENTAEIGGSVQTIGEIVKVFITFLIVLGFVFWAISFGKRVF